MVKSPNHIFPALYTSPHLLSYHVTSFVPATIWRKCHQADPLPRFIPLFSSIHLLVFKSSLNLSKMYPQTLLSILINSCSLFHTVQCPGTEMCPPCASGYRVDENGCETCRCVKCPSMESCHKFCPYGYQRGRNNCIRCRCEKCPPLERCSKQCVHGRETNDRGCQICKCKSKALLSCCRSCGPQGFKYNYNLMWYQDVKTSCLKCCSCCLRLVQSCVQKAQN